VAVIEKGTDAVINIITGGGPRMSIEERLRAAIHFQT
jgi:hypothetical protein